MGSAFLGSTLYTFSFLVLLSDCALCCVCFLTQDSYTKTVTIFIWWEAQLCETWRSSLNSTSWLQHQMNSNSLDTVLRWIITRGWHGNFLIWSDEFSKLRKPMYCFLLLWVKDPFSQLNQLYETLKHILYIVRAKEEAKLWIRLTCNINSFYTNDNQLHKLLDFVVNFWHDELIEYERTNVN